MTKSSVSQLKTSRHNKIKMGATHLQISKKRVKKLIKNYGNRSRICLQYHRSHPSQEEHRLSLDWVRWFPKTTSRRCQAMVMIRARVLSSRHRSRLTRCSLTKCPHLWRISTSRNKSRTMDWRRRYVSLTSKANGARLQLSWQRQWLTNSRASKSTLGLFHETKRGIVWMERATLIATHLNW